MIPEDNPAGFLVLIVQTISVILIWMIANVLVGIYFGYAFYEDSPGWQNYLYYILMLATLFFLIKYLIRKWK
jgi:ABC-type spermidine/putrescine transport system permease subunit I